MGGSCSSENSGQHHASSPRRRSLTTSAVKPPPTIEEEPEVIIQQDDVRASRHGSGHQDSTKLDLSPPTTHHKCRNALYARTTDVMRFDVPDDKVRWDVEFSKYSPEEYYAVHDVPIDEDPDFRKLGGRVKWNEQDGPVNRKGYLDYEVVDGLPRNPVGRTGIAGRGRLGRWGPNHAADPIVTRWKRDSTGKRILDMSTCKPVLQFIAIQRGDSGLWAIPGGFVDSGEEVYSALKREFCEEAMNSEEASADERKVMEDNIDLLFKEDKVEVYKGYVDDPRNTDNSWMETVAVNFHDESGELVGRLDLHAGDDAVGVKWRDIDKSLQLYASHAAFVRQVAKLRACHW